MKRIFADAICLAFDWMERPLFEYQSQGNWWHRVIGEKAQVAWFRAHNNRLYFWSDEARGQ